ncbi:MAG: lyase family protein, partial [Thermodesulfobacteriota bacterium]
MSEKPWGGRFVEKTDRITETFTSSIDVDKRLYAYDIEGSIAHCKTLARAAVITPEEADLLIQGLVKIKREIEREEFEFDQGLEDIHMNIEARLVNDIGKTAQKLHTARSRNDQVALDVRMYLRDETISIIQSLIRFRSAILDLADSNLGVRLPG